MSLLAGVMIVLLGSMAYYAKRKRFWFGMWASLGSLALWADIARNLL